MPRYHYHFLAQHIPTGEKVSSIAELDAKVLTYEDLDEIKVAAKKCYNFRTGSNTAQEHNFFILSLSFLHLTDDE